MNGTLFCRVMLLIVGVLAFALEDSQKSNASTDSHNPDNPNDSPFSLPFDSDIADQSDVDIPFP
jgi:hypothetical protein